MRHIQLMATEFHPAGENRRLEWRVLIDKPGRTGPGSNRFAALRLLEAWTGFRRHARRSRPGVRS